MSELIRPINEIDGRELKQFSVVLNGYLQNPDFKSYLYSRHMLGIIRCFGKSEERARAELNRISEKVKQGHIGIYAIVASDILVGLAEVNPRPTLRKNTTPTPPRFTPSFFSSAVPFHGPEVLAWTNPFVDPNYRKHLTEAYGTLRGVDDIANPIYTKYMHAHPETVKPIQAWTVEPFDTPPGVHDSILSAGYTHTRGQSGKLDDGSSSWHVPPSSRMYVATAPMASKNFG